jgi:uncharacterized protein YndB with AHSA1/START domain
MELDAATDLSFTRLLAVPRSVIWDCWTQAKHIPQFFVPAPHRVTACDIDLRVGGRFNTTFDVAGTVVTNKGVYLDVIPQEKIVFTDTYTEGWKPAADPFFTAIILLADAAGGATSYTAIVRHRSPEACKTHEDMGFFDGWGTVATQLEAYAKTLL